MVTIKLTIVMIVIEPDCLGFVSCHLWKDLSSLNIWSTHTDQRNPLGTNGQIQWCTQRNPLVTNEQIQFWSSSSKSSKRFPLRKLIYNCNWYQIGSSVFNGTTHIIQHTGTEMIYLDKSAWAVVQFERNQVMRLPRIINPNLVSSHGAVAGDEEDDGEEFWTQLCPFFHRTWVTSLATLVTH